MASTKKKDKGKKTARQTSMGESLSYFFSKKWVRESLGIFFFSSMLFTAVSLFSQIERNGVIRNSCGAAGKFIAGFLWMILGWTAPLILIVLGIIGLVMFLHRRFERILSRLLGLVIFFSGICILLAGHADPAELNGIEFQAGGCLGAFLYRHIHTFFGGYGTDILCLSAILVAVLMITDISYTYLLAKLYHRTGETYFSVIDWISIRYRQWKESMQRRKKGKEKPRPVEPEQKTGVQDELPDSTVPVPPVIVSNGSSDPGLQGELFPEEEEGVFNGTDLVEDTEDKGQLLATKPVSFEFPDLSLLKDPPDNPERETEEELVRKSELLVKKLADFNIQGRVTEVCLGPVITRYEFEPAPGIKISKITGLTDDLALGLKSKFGLRVAPIPGKSTLGVEIPNTVRETVYLKELLRSEEFIAAHKKSLLAIPLGKDTAGRPFVSDLKRMPHLLIAGATGSGKSVCINSILCGLLFSVPPDKLRLLLIDPKMLELSDFNGIPHLREPVITDVKIAPEALKWAMDEMNRRYALLASVGVRNIDQYNAKVEKGLLDETYAPLPYLVIVIDELADLMLTTPSVVEETIQRLAQMARASGIHLIIATQRPSVDVITGVIKANLPCRLAFQVASRVDSRTILDSIGAEKLLGMGDALFLPPGTSRLVRIHGAFVSEGEIKQVVAHLKNQPVHFNEESIFEEMKAADSGTEQDIDDPLYPEAVKLVISSGLASISFLQRRLKIGHSRASRLIDYMELEGLVGPHIGSKPREILVDKEEYFERLRQIDEMKADETY